MQKKNILSKIKKLLKKISPEKQKSLEVFLEHLEKKENDFYNELIKENKQLKHILKIQYDIHLQFDLKTTLTYILDLAIELTETERGFIIFENQEREIIARNFDKENVSKARLKISKSIAENVLKTGEILITPNAQNDQKLPQSISIKKLGLRSIVCLPLTCSNKKLGVLYLDNRFRKDAFSEQNIYILQSFAKQASSAIYNAILKKSIEQKAKEVQYLRKMKNVDTVQFVEKDITLFEEIITQSSKMQNIIELIKKIANSNVPILITGESGTGKSMIAKHIHKQSRRGDQCFFAENCAALSESLLESELFGYQKGAFTGANNDYKGLFEQANNGTLFLDEVGDMSWRMQGKILKVLEDGIVRPVGSSQLREVNIRLICATNKNLKKMIEQKEFREDLWYRLKVIHIEIPPLRERPEDIIPLFQHFLKRELILMGKQNITIDECVHKTMLLYNWPGNTRQLSHEVKKIIALKESGEKIEIKDLSHEIRAKEKIPIPSNISLKEAVNKFEQNYIWQVLQDVEGNKTKAAEILKLSRRSLYNKFHK